MSGLDKIIEKIEDAASDEADEIIAKAKTEADEIIAKAKEDAKAISSESEHEAGLAAKEIERASESAVALLRRQKILKTKQQILFETLTSAKESLYDLPSDRYFALLKKLAQNASMAGAGLVMLNEKDLARLPNGFEDDLNNGLLPDRSLKISGEARNIDGGLVLKYGGIEENCSFDAVFSARWDEFSDMIRNTLFA